MKQILEPQDVKDIVEANLERLTDLLCLWEWDITIDYGPCEREEWGAQCETVEAHREAFITIDPDRVASKGEGKVLDALRHEMLHIALRAMTAYRRVVWVLIPEDDNSANAAERAAWDHSIERSIWHFERILDRLSGETEDEEPERDA